MKKIIHITACVLMTFSAVGVVSIEESLAQGVDISNGKRERNLKLALVDFSSDDLYAAKREIEASEKQKKFFENFGYEVAIGGMEGIFPKARGVFGLVAEAQYPYPFIDQYKGGLDRGFEAGKIYMIEWRYMTLGNMPTSSGAAVDPGPAAAPDSEWHEAVMLAHSHGCIVDEDNRRIKGPNCGMEDVATFYDEIKEKPWARNLTVVQVGYPYVSPVFGALARTGERDWDKIRIEVNAEIERRKQLATK